MSTINLLDHEDSRTEDKDTANTWKSHQGRTGAWRDSESKGRHGESIQSATF